jgi:hypothetical protein
MAQNPSIMKQRGALVEHPHSTSSWQASAHSNTVLGCTTF